VWSYASRNFVAALDCWDFCFKSVIYCFGHENIAVSPQVLNITWTYTVILKSVWRWRQQVVPKRRFLTKLHDVTAQKIIFMFTGLRSSSFFRNGTGIFWTSSFGCGVEEDRYKLLGISFYPAPPSCYFNGLLPPYWELHRLLCHVNSWDSE
jgi:hypothetical protein